MTPKEKAEELINKHRIILIQSDTDAGEEIVCTTIAKQCALIAVDQIMNISLCEGCKDCCVDIIFWEEVKTELENYENR